MSSYLYAFVAVLLVWILAAGSAAADEGCFVFAEAPHQREDTVTPRFSATEILDLDFHVLFAANLAGEHLLHLRLSTPRAHTYQTLTVPFSTTPSRARATRRVTGFPRPLAVVHPERIEHRGQSYEELVVSWPVAGTSIVHSSLYGEWRVEAFLDADAEPCAEQTFELVE